MKRCADVARLLPEYLEGELPEVVRRRVANHLEICRDCRAEAARWQVSLGALRAVPRRKAPAGLYSAFAAARDSRPVRPAVLRAPLQWAYASAFVLVIAGATALMVRAPHVRSGGVPPRFAAVKRVSTPMTATSTRMAAVPGASATAGASGVATSSVSSQATGTGAKSVTPSSVSARKLRVASSSVSNGAVRRSVVRPRNRVRRTMVASVPSSFLAVRDAQGRSVRDVLRDTAVLRRQRVSGTGADPSLSGTGVGARPVVVESALDERVRVGGKVTRVTGNRGWDSQGRLALIQVAAESVSDK